MPDTQSLLFGLAVGLGGSIAAALLTGDTTVDELRGNAASLADLDDDGDAEVML